MGKSGKTGKSRKDFYYTLAKEQGFRARSAFKLTQLGNKFNIFKDALYVLDLCAAPGGWMQVARQAIPMAGHVFGVDLVAIKPIEGCSTIISDITSESCCKLLNRMLAQHDVPKNKVDIVLHDGAPNVGSSWVMDAYNQNILVIKALELTTKYLKQDGIFITKVFRSQDYQNILNMLNELFDSCQATKPSSSRNVSAEIFVVCKKYNPKVQITQNFFNIDIVFKKEDENKKSTIISEALLPVSYKAAINASGMKGALKQISKNNRQGYEVGDDYRKCKLSQYLYSAKPTELLLYYNCIEIDIVNEVCQKLATMNLIGDDIKDKFKDLKLLDKGEYKKLLKWRYKALKTIHDVDITTQQEKVEKGNKNNINEEILEEEELDALISKEVKEKIRAIKQMKAKYKTIERKMKESSSLFDAQNTDELLFTNPNEAMLLLDEENYYIDSDNSINDCSTINCSDRTINESGIHSNFNNSAKQLKVTNHAEYLAELELELNEYQEMLNKTEAFKKLKSIEKKKSTTRRESAYITWGEELKQFTNMIESKNRRKLNDPIDDDDDTSDNILLVDEMNDNQNKIASDQEELSKENVSMDDNLEMLDNSDILTLPLNDKKLRHLKRVKKIKKEEIEMQKKQKRQQELLNKLGGTNVISGNSQFDTPNNDRSVIKLVDANIISDIKPQTAEEFAEIQSLGLALKNKSSRIDIIDSMYSKWRFEDPQNLPEWFINDDKNARRIELPLTKEYSRQLSKKIYEISNRPIRKVLEARYRRNKHLQQKMDKIKKNIKAVADNAEYNEKGKQKIIKKLQNKLVGIKTKKTNKVYTVTTKSGTKRTSKTKAGKLSGKIVAVDRRLRADKRKKGRRRAK